MSVHSHESTGEYYALMGGERDVCRVCGVPIVINTGLFRWEASAAFEECLELRVSLFDSLEQLGIQAVRDSDAYPRKRGATREMLAKLRIVREVQREVAGDRLVLVFGVAGSHIPGLDWRIVQVEGGWQRGDWWVAEVFFT